MIIDISDIISNNNQSKEFTCSIDMSDITYNHNSYPIINSKPFELSIANEVTTLHITCDTSLGVHIPCDRCTKEVEHTFDVVIDKSFKLEDDKVVADDEEIPYFDSGNLDVDMLIFDEILICWPAKVLCQEDCRGLCPDCGINLNDSTCDCASKPKDPRMAKIRDVFREFKEV